MMEPVTAFSIYSAILNLPDVTITGISLAKRTIKIACCMTTKYQVCPKCGATCAAINGRTTRHLRDLNMMEREVHLELTVHQFYCSSCHHYHTQEVDFAAPNKSYTHRQAKYVFELCQKQSYKEISAIVNMNSKTVERLVLDECEKKIALDLRYARVKRLGIDEQSHRKGKKDFICILTDLDTGTIIDILADRKKETLVAHFQSLGESFCQQITDVSCDIWSPYITTIETCFPNANLILDRFHVTKLLNESLDKMRKELRQAHKEEKVFKKLKWVLFKQYYKLSDAELDILDDAFKAHPALQKNYFLREEFHHILENNDDVNIVLTLIDQWIEKVKLTQEAIFEPFIKTLLHYKTYVANYVKDNLSNAVTEGLNNLVRSIRRMSFGIPNFKHLRLRALAIST